MINKGLRIWSIRTKHSHGGNAAILLRQAGSSSLRAQYSCSSKIIMSKVLCDLYQYIDNDNNNNNNYNNHRNHHDGIMMIMIVQSLVTLLSYFMVFRSIK